MTIEEVSGPEDELMTLEEAKLYCRYTENDDNDYLETLIVLAREQIETYTQRTVAKKRFKMTLDGFPYWDITFPKDKIASLVSFQYRDENGDMQDVDPSIYDLQIKKEPGVILRKPNSSWHKTNKEKGSVVLVYDVGWEPEEVPKNIIVAAKSLVKFYYHERELVEKEAVKTPSWFHALLFPFKVWEKVPSA